MTSNAGASSIIEPKRLGFGAGEDEKQDHERMKNSVMEEMCIRDSAGPSYTTGVFHTASCDAVRL